MKRVARAAGLLFVMLMSLSGRGDGGEVDLQTLRGKWRLVGFERGTIVRAPDQVPVGWISFEHDGRFSAAFPDHQMGGTVTVDPTREPAAIDFTHTRGLDQGKSMFAIYRMEGEQLLICTSPPGNPGKDRPTRFSTKGADSVLFTFERSPLGPAPQGFDTRREGIARGRIETIEYESKNYGGSRPLVIYLPPGYTKDAKYPVLYLLHGAGQNETIWREKGQVDVILDNLYADRKLVPMIVVMPNATTVKDVPGQDPFQPFLADLVDDIIPTVEARYPVQSDREHRAIAGLSKGGSQAVWIGLKHRDRFGSIGGFCSSLTGDAETTPPIVRDLVGDTDDASRRFRLFWLSCGDTDELLPGNEHFHAALDALKVPHLWHVDFGGHTWPVWKNDLYLFSQMLFREEP